MTGREQLVNQFLSGLDLNKEEILIYKTLIKKSPLTVLALSRVTNIPRTQLYRFIEKMQSNGLVEEIIDEHKKLYQSISPDDLERLIIIQENKAKSLRGLFQPVKDLLVGQTKITQAETKVIFYRGKKGIQQMVWNELKAQNEVAGYTHRVFESAVGKAFAKKIYEEFRLRNIRFKEIYSDEFLESLTKDGYEQPQYLANQRLFNTESRYIPKNILDIQHQLDIYNDVVAYYSWFEGEIFGVEIHNQKVADLQKQLFNLVWNQAKVKTFY